MEQYISKDALVVEIKTRIETYNKGYANGDDCRADALETFLHDIDFLEVKEVDFEKDVRQIVSLYYEGIKHYDDVIKKERKENGGSDLAIKILDGVVDARELGIQYVIDKLKAQKGE